LVEEKNDVAAFANYKDKSDAHASATAQPQEKKVETSTTASAPTQQKAQSASTEKHSSGKLFIEKKVI